MSSSDNDELSPLEVFLNGKRTYVQGTQLVARATEFAAKTEKEPLTVSAAAFQRITDKLVFIRPGAPQKSGEDDKELGSLVLRGSDGPLNYTFVEGSEEAPRRDVPPACTYALVAGSQSDVLSGTFEIAGLSTPEDYLVALVQSVKQLHEGISDSVHDIWFTGLRAANLPVTHPFPCATGRLTLSYRRLMQGEDAWQSLLAVEMTDPDGAPVTKSAISFAFKSETRPNVD
ncbi:MAG: hypothetical protein AAFV38_09805 [Pseudomonadota bacterium]